MNYIYYIIFKSFNYILFNFNIIHNTNCTILFSIMMYYIISYILITNLGPSNQHYVL